MRTDRFASSVSLHPIASFAGGEVVGDVVERIGTGPDIAIVFVTAAYSGALEDLCALVQQILRPACLLGVVASGLLCGDQGVEDGPGVSLWAGHIGAVEPVRLDVLSADEGTAIIGMPDAAADPNRTLVLLADPESFPTAEFLDSANTQYPGLVIVGGLVSGASRTSTNRLVLDGLEHRDGAIGFLLESDVATRVVVSQGCRPVGEPFTVTRSSGNLVQELGGVAAMDRLQGIIDAADDEQRQLLAAGLQIGVVVNEHRDDFVAGDFVIHSVIGATRSSRSVAVGAPVPVGATVQFQVRDRATAHQDLIDLLPDGRVASALVFSCEARGAHFFGEPDHDVRWVTELTASAATGGMFCAGEIGPIGQRNHLHRFSMTTLLFL